MDDPGSSWPLSDEERRRLRTLNRRAWGATLFGTALALVAFGIAGVAFILWLLRGLDSARF